MPRGVRVVELAVTRSNAGVFDVLVEMMVKRLAPAEEAGADLAARFRAGQIVTVTLMLLMG